MRMILTVLVLSLLASPIHAQPVRLAGQQSVAEFREEARKDRSYSIGFAVGIATLMNLVMVCDHSSSAGEIEAYLLYSVDPTVTVWQALIINANRLGCAFSNREKMAEVLARPPRPR